MGFLLISCKVLCIGQNMFSGAIFMMAIKNVAPEYGGSSQGYAPGS